MAIERLRVDPAVFDEFGDPKVNHSGNRIPTTIFDEDIGRLEIPMDDRALMGVLYRGTDLLKQADAIPDRETMAFAVFDQGFTLDQFHDNIRAIGMIEPSINHARDPLVVHASQYRSFRTEPCDHRGGREVGPKDLDGNRTLYGDQLLSAIHHAEPTTPDFLPDPVTIDDRRLNTRTMIPAGGLCGATSIRSINEQPSIGAFVGLDELLRLLGNRWVGIPQCVLYDFAHSMSI